MAHVERTTAVTLERSMVEIALHIIERTREAVETGAYSEDLVAAHVKTLDNAQVLIEDVFNVQ